MPRNRRTQADDAVDWKQPELLSTSAFFQGQKQMATTITFESLKKAAQECARGVKWKDSIATWVHPRNLAANCLKLWRELDSGKYKLGGYVVFDVVEPKRRTIRSPRFRDRVVQRAMCNTGLYDDLTRGNIYDNAACQKGKGTTFAMDRLECHLQRHFRKHGLDGWCLRLDIRKFFDSIPHEQLKNMVMLKVRNPEYCKYVLEVIDSFNDPGIGLGSQISQLLAISYLSDLDHWFKETLGISGYVRYSDDIVAIHKSKLYLQDAWDVAESKLAALGLSLNPKSTLHPIRHGIDFLKFKFRLTKTGKVIRILNRKSHVRIVKRLRRLIAKTNKGERQWNDVINCFNSWKSHAEQGNSHTKVRRIEQWLNNQQSLHQKM